MTNSASGSLLDKQKKSYVESPARGSTETAQEVFIGNTNDDAIPVIISGSNSGTRLLNYYTVNGLVKSVSTSVFTYTVPLNKKFGIESILISSDCISTYYLYVNSIIKGKKRIYYTDYNAEFVFKNVNFLAGDVIELVSVNNSDNLAEINVTLIGVVYDE